MALSVNIDKKPMLDLVGQSIKQIFKDPKTPFWTGRVMDLLYDGIEIDCSSTEFAAQATCSVLGSGDVKSIKIVNEELFKLSMMGGVSVVLLLFLFQLLSIKQSFIRLMGRPLEYIKCFVVLKIFVMWAK